MIMKKKSIVDCKNRQDVADLLGIELSVLNYFAYSERIKYKSFTIAKKSGGRRQIKAPPGPLINIQKILAQKITDVYPGHISAKGFARGQSIIKNASLHVGKTSVLNLDVKDFFPSITSMRIYGLLKAEPFSLNNETASVITKLVTYEGSLPQGAPTSPILSNMICYRLDTELLKLSKKHRCTYTRYADDITISSRQKLPAAIAVYDESAAVTELGRAITDVLTNNGFVVNDKKTRLQSGYMSKYVTGVKVNKIPNLQRKFIKEVKAMLHSWDRYGHEATQKKFEDDYNGSGRKIEDVIHGRINFIKDVKGHTDLVYRKLYNQLVELQSRDLSVFKDTLPIDKIEDLYNRVYVVKNGISTGSGFVVQGEGFMTCDHVISGDDNLSFFDNRSVFDTLRYKRLNRTNSVRSSENEFDLALMKISDEDIEDSSHYLKLSKDDVVVGGVYTALGFPSYINGEQPRATPVTVTVLKNDDNGITRAYVENALIKGNSGGPVINDDNEIVGIVQLGGRSYAQSNASIGFAFLPVQEIRKFMKESKENDITDILDIVSVISSSTEKV